MKTSSINIRIAFNSDTLTAVDIENIENDILGLIGSESREVYSEYLKDPERKLYENDDEFQENFMQILTSIHIHK